MKVIEFPAARIVKGVHHFTPEMGQRKVNCQMEVTIGHYCSYYIKTPLELKGQGITFIQKYAVEGLVSGSYLIGWNQYKVTDRAYGKLKAQYSISMESNLD
jgi:hypothetical protein